MVYAFYFLVLTEFLGIGGAIVGMLVLADADWQVIGSVPTSTAAGNAFY
jgi:hypothetical protein